MFNLKVPYLIIVCLWLIHIQANGQSEIKVHKKNFKTEKEGFRKAYRHVKKGNQLLAGGKGNLGLATEQYLTAYDYNSDCFELNYKIGLCYLQSGTKGKAASYILAATKEHPEYFKNDHFVIAKALQYSLEFDNAIEQYNIFLASMSRRTEKKYADEVYRRIDECKNAKELMARPVRAIIKNMGEGINSGYNDYNSIVIGDTVMTFSSRRPFDKKDKPSILDKSYDEDVYNASLKNKTWQPARFNEEPGINDEHNNNIVWVTYTTNARYVYNGYKRNGDIFLSEWDEDTNEWKKPKRFKRNFNSPFQETSVSLTADENTMFFSSSDNTESFGGQDIFVCTKNNRGKWSTPENIGAILNSDRDEVSVCVTPDGKNLYFSSNGHNTMGGFDVFKSSLKENGTWSTPENIGYPINSPDDELFFKPSPKGRKAYFSSKRSDSKGGVDIYEATFLGAEKNMLLLEDEQLVSFFEAPELFTLVPGETKVDTSVTYYVKGTVTDIKKGTPIMAKIDLVDQQVSQAVASTISDSLGNYQLLIPKLQTYGVEIKAKDYMLYLDMIPISKPSTGNVITKNFALTRIAAGVKIVLKNIYFESGKAVLTKDSYAELDKVVAFLQETPELKIEISGHTDNVGSVALNTKLSLLRAQAVVNYISSKGIAMDQLVPKGYGPAQPIAPNKTAAGKKMNRRVEFKILSAE